MQDLVGGGGGEFFFPVRDVVGANDVQTLVSGSGYSRGATVSARPTDAPFVDFPLSYFDVPTDPVFTGTALPTDMPSVGERPGMSLTQVLGACLAVALWTQM